MAVKIENSEFDVCVIVFVVGESTYHSPTFVEIDKI